ncbi:kinetochore Sim4 complex subunit FTA2-domain-containing protein [Xylaria arbuscula]|nr:kinetochore Sim4 complex subunit FTA2-domain-containing protein [Xylaria arbuscula]
MPNRITPRRGASQPPALPPCPGPRLAAFQHQNAQIRWIKRLDIDRNSESTTQGCVYQVEIKSKIYALKVFKFFDPATIRWYWESELENSVPMNEIIFYTDPFFAECRAYGRIKEAQTIKGFREKLAVPCHGYLFLTKRDEMWLRRDGISFGSRSISEEYRPPHLDTNLIRAIVKDFDPRPSGLNSRNVRQALHRLRRLNDIQVYNGDIRGDNFKGGYLVDFGTSQTEPHSKKLEDMVMFDDAVLEDNVKTTVKALPKRRQLPPREAKGSNSSSTKTCVFIPG